MSYEESPCLDPQPPYVTESNERPFTESEPRERLGESSVAPTAATEPPKAKVAVFPALPVQAMQQRTHLPQRFWSWIGLKDKTLFDLLQLLGASIAVPVFLALLTYQQAKTADDRQRHEMMSNYFDEMTELMLNKNLGEPEQNSKVQSMARARTLSTLRQLDGERKGQLLKFLYESNLIGQCKLSSKPGQPTACQASVLDLNGARLNETTFDQPVPLPGINLTAAFLPGAQLPKFDLSRAQLQNATLEGANLTEALLDQAQMVKVQLVNAVLKDANLYKATLNGAFMRKADLSGATLTEAKLDKADLQDANLSNATLTKAILQKAILKNANLNNADLAGANLKEAKLTGADLTSANLENADLSGADLSGAILTETNLKGAKWDNNTEFPTGFDRKGKGMQK